MLDLLHEQLEKKRLAPAGGRSTGLQGAGAA